MGLKPALKISSLEVVRSRNFRLKVEDFEASAGKIIGVAGPNGSGKTTLLEALTGIAKIQNGQIWLAGKILDNNLRQTKALLGYVPDDENWFVGELTAREYFKLLRGIYEDAGRTTDENFAAGLARQLRFVNFDQQLETLSHGNKKKVQLIAGLMHKPEILVIDELRNGLDPLAIIAAEKIVKQAARDGTCVIAASHDLWWAQRVTDQILLLDDGKPLIHDETKNLVRRFGSLEKLFIGIADGKLAVPKA